MSVVTERPKRSQQASQRKRLRRRFRGEFPSHYSVILYTVPISRFMQRTSLPAIEYKGVIFGAFTEEWVEVS